jgi:hypothetical protein
MYPIFAIQFNVYMKTCTVQTSGSIGSHRGPTDTNVRQRAQGVTMASQCGPA